MGKSAEEHKPKRLWNILTAVSRARYLFWRFIARTNEFTVRLKTGERLALRSQGDRNVAWEVFVLRLYYPPTEFDIVSPAWIVDLGANVGFSTLYFAKRYPTAEILAFEPHPDHCKQFEWHVRQNGLAARVRLIAAAAGTRESRLGLSDAAAGSSLIIPRGRPSITVSVVDWFESVKCITIDLLKMDIEGSEYELLHDPRFAELEIRTLVMECHTIPERQLYPSKCIEILQSLHYRTEVISEGECTMIWATKERPRPDGVPAARHDPALEGP